MAGNLQVTVEGTVLVRVLQGFAAQTAVQSAIMAEDGLVGPERVFQGEWGYFKSYHDNKYRADVLTEGLGDEWKLRETSIKYYPCCFLAHFAIQAMRDLVADKKVRPADIEAITARVTQGTYNVVCCADRGQARADDDAAGAVQPALHGGGGRPHRPADARRDDAGGDRGSQGAGARRRR